jgi:hypothetical protein
VRKKVLFSLIFISFSFSLSSIEVSGHLTEDTIWSPDNNPYHVIDNIYVDEGVTLTILPGTEIYIQSAPLTSWQDFNEHFWYQNGTNDAKMFWVDGRIIAEGTEQDSILFTRLQDDNDYFWGTIFITDDAGKSIFKYCTLENAGGLGIYVGLIAYGMITFMNKELEIERCKFLNYVAGLHGNNVQWYEYISVLNNIFQINNEMSEYAATHYKEHLLINNPIDGYPPPLIAGNEFIGSYRIDFPTGYFISNKLTSNESIGVDIGGRHKKVYLYDNEFIDYENGIICWGVSGDSIYIKNNRFFGGDEAINIDDAYVEISDNYFEGCVLVAYHSYLSKIINNNFINSSGTAITGNVSVITNNIISNYNRGLSGRGDELFSNNIFIDNDYIFSSVTDNHIIENNIFISNDELYMNFLYGNPIFHNCILDFELPLECIDGGGNIWVDSLQAQTLFEDITNGDFHLIEGSLAIDAGFDTTGYYYPFDLDYNHRFWDGDNNGTAIIDIGPYEYSSPSFGGIEGFTYNPITEDPVDFVLLKINNEPGEFTFSDSLGNFEYKLPAGTYDIYCERMYYDDVIEYEVEVVDGQFTQIQIPMFEIVGVTQNQVPNTQCQLTNFPNPFNPSGAGRSPETTIEFTIPTDSKVEIKVFNIKGQEVRKLINEHLIKGTHSIVWNGIDSNNKHVSSGIYFYKITAGKESIIKKMLLFK